MSDKLLEYHLKKYKGHVKVDTDHSLQYIRRQCVNADEIVFTVHITNYVLKRWQDLKEQEAFSSTQNFCFVKLLNRFLGENHAILIRENSKRIEDHLRRIASSVKSNFRGKQGSAAKKFGSLSKRVAVRRGELRNATEIEYELSKLKEAKADLEAKNCTLNQRCEELYQCLLQAETLRTINNEKLAKADSEIESLKKENVRLWEYFDKISEQEGIKNCGKNITEGKERQQRRKVKELKTYVDKALWFAGTFGLQLSSVKFKDDTGRIHTIEYQKEAQAKKSYNDLNDEEKAKVQQVLFIADKFCISESAYHEMTMCASGELLPRSYLVKQCKTHLNSLCQIHRIAGGAEGAALDFEAELKNTIEKQVSSTDLQYTDSTLEISCLQWCLLVVLWICKRQCFYQIYELD